MIPTIIGNIYSRLENKDSFDKKEMQLYMDVLRFYNDDSTQLSKKSVSAKEKRDLIIFLIDSGHILKGPFGIIDDPGKLNKYLVDENFKMAIQLARKVRDVYERAKIEEAKIRQGYCPLALNSYDCRRLIDETNNLFCHKYGEEIKTKCPTLAKLVEDIEEIEEKTLWNNGDILNPYPARHICDLQKLKGRTGSRYIHLRLMDMVLYDHDPGLTDNQLRAEILKYAKTYNLDIKLPDNLNNLRNIYKQLIADGVIGSQRQAYSRTGSVIENLQLKNDSKERDMAFKAEISLYEAFHIEKELNELMLSEFKHKQVLFRESFPLLYALSNINGMMDFQTQKIDDTFISVRGFQNTASAFVTVDYIYDKIQSIRSKLIDYVNYNIPIAISSGTISGKYLLKKLYDKQSGCIVDAVDLSTGEFKKLKPMDLISMQELDINDCSEEENRILGKHAFLFGVGEPYDNTVRDITIELKSQGTQKFIGPKKWKKLHVKLISQYNGPQPREYGDIVSLKVCLNDDFMKEIAYLDKKGYFFRIYPEDVMSTYEKYLCKHYNITKRWPLEDRPINSQGSLQNYSEIYE